jgi:hypothetical protein
MRWDDEDLAGVDGVRGAIVEVETEGALKDEGELLVVMRVAGYDASLAEHDAGKHSLGAGDELAGEERVELFGFDFAPTMKSGSGHGKSLSGDSGTMIRDDEFLALCCAIPCVE